MSAQPTVKIASLALLALVSCVPPTEGVSEDAGSPGSTDPQLTAPSLSASQDLEDRVRLSWSIDPVPVGLTGFQISRAGVVVATVDAGEREFEDLDVPAGALVAPAGLEATALREDAVLVSWEASLGEPGPTVSYTIVAVRGAAQSPPATASGARAAATPQTFEVSRDDGATWLNVGGKTEFLDEVPPVLSLTQGTPDFARGAIRLEAGVALRDNGQVQYRVRSVAGDLYSAPSGPAVGTFQMGDVMALVEHVQWERAAAVDGAFVALPDVTGWSWLDLDPQLPSHVYRARVRFSSGAEVLTTPKEVASPLLVDLASGFTHVCAVRASDKRVVCWGNNEKGQASPPPVAFRAITAGRDHTCAIRDADDTVSCWGSTVEATPPPGAFRQIAAGAHHTCGVRTDDKIVCWGNNAFGQVPVVPSAESFDSVVSGDWHSCGLRSSDGKAVCWGNNQQGQAPNPSFNVYTALYAGGGRTCGVRASDGKVLCWGSGFGATETALTLEGPFSSLTMNSTRVCGIRSGDQRVVCTPTAWYGTTLNSLPYPATPSVDGFVSVSASNSFVCGIRASGAASCWGRDEQSPHRQVPILPAAEPFTRILGDEVMCGARASDGRIACWDSTLNRYPRHEPLPAVVKAFSVGDGHGCAIRSADDKVVCWGSNTSGEAPSSPSTSVFKAVAAGGMHTCGIGSDDRIRCWGSNNSGQAPANTSIEALDVAAGHAFTCVIRSADEKVVCFGENGSGQAPTDPSTDSFLAISAASNHACGLRKSDQRPVCWGANIYGQSNAPITGKYSAVSTSGSHACAIEEPSGRVRCWGANSRGQSGPSKYSYKQVAAFGATTCAVRAMDDKVVCWGREANGVVP